MTERMRSTRGYSLIETLVVLAIISVLAGVAVPNFIDWNRKYQLRAAVADFQGQLRLARLTAMNVNAPVNVVITQTGVTSPVTIAFVNAKTGAAALAPLVLNRGITLTNAAGATLGAGAPTVNSPQQVSFNTAGLWTNNGVAGNLCIAAAGAYAAGGCGNPLTSAQAINFRHSSLPNENYRVVVFTTGKISWCRVATCAQ